MLNPTLQRRADQLFMAIGRLQGRASRLAGDAGDSAADRLVLEQVEHKLDEAWRVMHDAGMVR